MLNLFNISYTRSEFNYGQRLQTYALQKFMKSNLGQVMKTLDTRKTSQDFPSFETCCMSQVYIGGKAQSIPSNMQIDAIIYGGDQIWKWEYNKHNDGWFIGTDQKSTVIKYSYSASINGSEKSINDDRFIKSIAQFSGISVREKDDANKLNKRFKQLKLHCSAMYHIDPALLLTCEQWASIAMKPEKVSEETFVFEYLIARKKNDRVENGVKIYSENGNAGGEIKDHMDPREWIWMIKNCKELRSSSYHGFVFGLLFNKKMVGVNVNDYRIKNLMSILGIQIRDGVIINYDEVMRNLELERKRSYSYLSDIVHDKLFTHNEYCAYSIKDRHMSTSGGMSAEIAKYVFSKGGIVYGASYTQDFNGVKIIPVTNIIDYYTHISGSKYSYSIPPKFKDVKSYLDQGKIVMYTGLPCQITALQRYLGKDYSNLLKVELLCGGVSSNNVLKGVIQDIERNLGSKVISFNMRYKHQSKCWYLLENGEQGVITNLNSYEAFINSCRLPMCSNCTKHMGSGYADLVIGDFWPFYNKGRVTDECFSAKNGTSIIYVFSRKGQQFFDMVTPNITYKKI